MKYKSKSIVTPIDRSVRPPYKCFCCNDSGIVQMTEDQYDRYIEGELNTRLICSRRGCEEGAKYSNAYYADRTSDHMSRDEYQANFDANFPPSLSEEIHREKYRLWGELIKNQPQIVNRAVAIANTVENLVNFNF